MFGSMTYVIGLYVIMRSVSIITRTGERSENPITKSIAVITMLVTVVVLAKELVRYIPS